MVPAKILGLETDCWENPLRLAILAGMERKASGEAED